MTTYSNVQASQVHTRCEYGNIPPVCQRWHDQSHCRGEFPRVKQAVLWGFSRHDSRKHVGTDVVTAEMVRLMTERDRWPDLTAHWRKRGGPVFVASKHPSPQAARASLKGL